MPRFQVRNAPYSIYVNGVDGAPGNALSCPNSASLNPTAAYTVETWFKPVGPQKAFILTDNSNSGTTNSVAVIVGSDRKMNWYSTINGIARNIASAGSRIVAWGEWNLFSGTFTGAAINLFLNGQQYTEQITGLSGALGTNPGPFRIGAFFSGGASLTFQGFLWRTRVYAAGMTLAEHQSRYYSNVTSSALQSALRLDAAMTEGSGSTTADASGNGNTLTLGASASWSTDTPFKLRTIASARTLAAPRTLAGPRTLVT